MKKLFTLILSMFIYTSVAFADDRLALAFNIIADDDSKKNSVIDTKAQKKLSFKLFANQNETIYMNGQEIVVVDNKFEVDVTNLEGKQEIKFTNNLNEETTFTYYFSNESGLVKDYSLENKKTYVTTLDDVKILYTSKDAKKIELVKNVVANMPATTKTNLTEITLLPTDHASGAAGITTYDKITLYNISSYTNNQIKNIVSHEIAHTWAYDLMKEKVLDYTYTDFSEAAEEDGNYVTKYSKTSASEDFAESVSFYFIDTADFEKNYPARAEYIEGLLR